MAVVDYFLKLDGIAGESQDEKHKGEIDVLSIDFGAKQASSNPAGGGAGAGRAHLHDLRLVTKFSKASPKIVEACANGDHIKTAVFVQRKAGKEQQEYHKITLSEVLISSYQVVASSSGDDLVPTEHIALNFAKIEVEYKEQKADGTLGGTVKSGWNHKLHLKV